MNQDSVNALRILCIDAVEKANSGHPGMPLGMADIAAVLWQKFLNYNPCNPHWFNRDRFILSNGHGSILLYALLHLSGYKLSIAELKNFRKLNSKTPGHPEHDLTPGVDTTTGPLGQGLANAVGMALAEKNLAANFNTADIDIINHFTYVFAGDGCLMEGISHEACSLAGVLALGKLIVFYDDNGISIDGAVDGWFKDDTAMRFRAYNWQVIENIDGHKHQAITQAIIQARENTTQPTIILCKTTIGHLSANAGSAKTHGAPLGCADIAQIKTKLAWEHAPFEIPENIYKIWNNKEQGLDLENAWLAKLAKYRSTDSAKYAELLRRCNNDLPDNFLAMSDEFIATLPQDSNLATRKSSQNCLDFYTKLLPEMLGGSADLTGSNNTLAKDSKLINQDIKGSYLQYGVREFAMAAIMNGLAIHGGFIPYGGTFLVFSDYARNALRMSALMHQKVIYVLSHDSVGLGEDGPTHQPIEQLSSLRLIPNLYTWRPATLSETAVAWQQALKTSSAPSCILLTRQNLPELPFDKDINKGAYIIRKVAKPNALLLATGSEVHLAYQAAQEIEAISKFRLQVVSMPCMEKFLEQSCAYQEKIIPSKISKRLAIEAGSTGLWYRFAPKVIGIDSFGVSAPGDVAFKHLGISVENIIKNFLD